MRNSGHTSTGTRVEGQPPPHGPMRTRFFRSPNILSNFATLLIFNDFLMFYSNIKGAPVNVCWLSFTHPTVDTFILNPVNLLISDQPALPILTHPKPKIDFHLLKIIVFSHWLTHHLGYLLDIICVTFFYSPLSKSESESVIYIQVLK
jgi:hypothetical protein